MSGFATASQFGATTTGGGGGGGGGGETLAETLAFGDEMDPGQSIFGPPAGQMNLTPRGGFGFAAGDPLALATGDKSFTQAHVAGGSSLTAGGSGSGVRGSWIRGTTATASARGSFISGADGSYGAAATVSAIGYADHFLGVAMTGADVRLYGYGSLFAGKALSSVDMDLYGFFIGTAIGGTVRSGSYGAMNMGYFSGATAVADKEGSFNFLHQIGGSTLNYGDGTLIGGRHTGGGTVTATSASGDGVFCWMNHEALAGDAALTFSGRGGFALGDRRRGGGTIGGRGCGFLGRMHRAGATLPGPSLDIAGYASLGMAYMFDRSTLKLRGYGNGAWVYAGGTTTVDIALASGGNHVFGHMFGTGSRLDVAGYGNTFAGQVRDSADVDLKGTANLFGGRMRSSYAPDYMDGLACLGWGSDLQVKGSFTLTVGKSIRNYGTGGSWVGGRSIGVDSGYGHIVHGFSNYVGYGGYAYGVMLFGNSMTADGGFKCFGVGAGHLITIVAGSYSGAFGSYNEVGAGDNALAIGHRARVNLDGEVNSASDRFSATGDSMFGWLHAQRTTTDGSTVELTIDGAAVAAGTNTWEVPDETAWGGEIVVTARRDDGSVHGQWRFEALAERTATVLSLVGSGAIGTPITAGTITTPTIAVTATRVHVNVTGNVGQTIRWRATFLRNVLAA